MTLKISVLEAGHGDAIVVETSIDNETFRILIDGGPPECFERRQGWKKTAGPLQRVLDDMYQKGERFDLTILTHVDDDHIGGLLKACRHEKYRSVVANDVWFNSGKLIAQGFDSQAPAGSSVLIDDPEDRLTSISQGVELDELLQQYCSSPRQLRFVDGCKIPFKHGQIIILSPTENQLKSLLTKWEREQPSSLTSGADTDYRFSFDELRERDEFSEDTSVHNASSIAVLIETQGKRVLLLGDALPSTVCETLRDRLGVTEDDPLRVEVCKLSHHGSKANTNKELLSLVRCEQFVISTNGTRHGLPDKATLARIDELQPESEVLFNYKATRERVFQEDLERTSLEKMKDLKGDLIF